MCKKTGKTVSMNHVTFWDEVVSRYRKDRSIIIVVGLCLIILVTAHIFEIFVEHDYRQMIAHYYAEAYMVDPMVEEVYIFYKSSTETSQGIFINVLLIHEGDYQLMICEGIVEAGCRFPVAIANSSGNPNSSFEVFHGSNEVASIAVVDNQVVIKTHPGWELILRQTR